MFMNGLFSNVWIYDSENLFKILRLQLEFLSTSSLSKQFKFKCQILSKPKISLANTY